MPQASTGGRCLLWGQLLERFVGTQLRLFSHCGQRLPAKAALIGVAETAQPVTLKHLLAEAS